MVFSNLTLLVLPFFFKWQFKKTDPCIGIKYSIYAVVIIVRRKAFYFITIDPDAYIIDFNLLIVKFNDRNRNTEIITQV